jgi:phosphatidylserine decarboxylase
MASLPRLSALAQRILLETVAPPALSRIYARIADLPLPGPVLQAIIRAWARGYGARLEEADRGIEDYDTLDDFFTRALRAGARPVQGEDGDLLSCADGRLAQMGPVDAGTLLQAKGRLYAIADLLDDQEAARPFHGGFAYTVYLAPGDYHRVHTPIGGRVVGYHHVPGRLYPVNDRGRRGVERLYCRNERVVVHMETDSGRAAVILVGATFVGRISLSFAPLVTNHGGPSTAGPWQVEPPAVLEAGSHLGTFHMGSTVVVLHEAGFEPARSAALGARVRVGELLAEPAKG